MSDAPPAPGPSHASIADPRAYFLARICVAPPYFDLSELSVAGDWVEAWATPVPPSDSEHDAVSCAESARHLAIAGSCAVSLRCPVPGKVYYPVLRAEQPEAETATNETATAAALAQLERVRVRARCTAFDLRASRATADCELLTADGALVRRLTVEYHVIPEPEFWKLFGDHAAETHEDSGTNPYLEHQPLPEITENDGSFSVALGEVDPAACLGHFRGYPALPLSILSRRAVDLVAAVLRRQRGNEHLRITIVSGTAETQSFVFAHESVALEARILEVGENGRGDLVRCNVRSGTREVAWFELRAVACEARHSGIQLRADALRAAGT